MWSAKPGWAALTWVNVTHPATTTSWGGSVKRARILAAAVAVAAVVTVTAVATPARADDGEPLMAAARAAVCGPEIKKHQINGHRFNIKPATINRWEGRTTFVGGQISHHLRWRFDDQVYYTIPYSDEGMPSEPDIEIDNGGVAAAFDLIADWIILWGGTKVSLPGGGDIDLAPNKLPEIATEISHLAQGRSWQIQAAATINFIGLAAATPMC
jgi:hypothetical protein